jgi:hypothetical protein
LNSTWIQQSNIVKQKALPASTFKTKALPLHINVTHTPPTIADSETVPAADADPGFIGNLSLLPSSFSTGSYGWKGTKRINVELQNDSGEKEKVSVMLTYVCFVPVAEMKLTLFYTCSINATVMGSKQAKEDDAGEEKEEDQEESKAKDAEEDGESSE